MALRNAPPGPTDRPTDPRLLRAPSKLLANSDVVAVVADADCGCDDDDDGNDDDDDEDEDIDFEWTA